MIRCKICGKLFRGITPGHLNTHNITTVKYKQKFSPKHMRCKSYIVMLKDIEQLEEI